MSWVSRASKQWVARQQGSSEVLGFFVSGDDGTDGLETHVLHRKSKGAASRQLPDVERGSSWAESNGKAAERQLPEVGLAAALSSSGSLRWNLALLCTRQRLELRGPGEIRGWL